MKICSVKFTEQIYFTLQDSMNSKRISKKIQTPAEVFLKEKGEVLLDWTFYNK